MASSSGSWRILLLLLLMGVGGSAVTIGWFALLLHHWGPIMDSMPKDQTGRINFIVFLDGLGMMMAVIFGLGFQFATLLRLSQDAVQLKALKCFWSAFLGVPTGVLLFALRWDGIARVRLGAWELWGMTALSVYLVIMGCVDAVAAWKSRREVSRFYGHG